MIRKFLINRYARRFGTVVFALVAALALGACASQDGEHEGHDHEAHEAREVGHDEHDGGSERGGDHSGHEDEGVVRLEPEQLREFGVRTAVAGSGSLHREIRLPGEVKLDMDRIAHVTPVVPGNVWKVEVQEGDMVRRGDLLAVMHSQQLADAKAAYLEAREQLQLTEANYERVRSLREEGITSVEELQSAERDLQGARIALRTAEQMLHAMDVHEERIAAIPDEPGVELSHYEFRAPIDGRVIRRALVQGQRVDESDEAFVIADLSHVWVEGDVYPRDLGVVREGMPVRVVAGYGIPAVRGTLDYVGPVVGEQTRTALARSVVENPDGRLRPGLFVTLEVATESFPVEVAVPRTALVQMEGTPHIFVREGHEFVPVPVTVGMENGSMVEIAEGLAPGSEYVTENGFVLKAEMEKGTFSGGHAH